MMNIAARKQMKRNNFYSIITHIEPHLYQDSLFHRNSSILAFVYDRITKVGCRNATKFKFFKKNGRRGGIVNLHLISNAPPADLQVPEYPIR